MQTEEEYTLADFRKVGRAVKSADPDTARMLRREDGVTSFEGIGRYVLGCDPADWIGLKASARATVRAINRYWREHYDFFGERAA